MPKSTYIDAVKQWELLFAVPAARAEAQQLKSETRLHEKAAGARFETDSDGRAQDRFDDPGAPSV